MDYKIRELEGLVASQKEQLNRYEKRLKDVVTAYKGLLKEKEALESTLTAITGIKETAATTLPETKKECDVPTEEKANGQCNNDKGNIENNNDQLQAQIRTLMNSLATLSAEKSRMEASFQADKKQLRLQSSQKDNFIAGIQMKMKENEERAKANVDEMKAKWIIERQEREKETNNQMLMIREMQKLYSDERHLKENIEIQLNNFKTQFVSNESENCSVRELQEQLKEARSQLKQLQNNLKLNSNGATGVMAANIDNTALLLQVKKETLQLKEQHAIAIKCEQKRLHHVEEQSRRQATFHEDRVASLEARLSELSNSVGLADRLRQQDQDNIMSLKKKLHELELNGEALTTHLQRQNDNGKQQQQQQQHRSQPIRKTSIPLQDMSAIVEEIVRLKKLLVNESSRSANHIDVCKVFSISDDHVRCQDEMTRMQQQIDAGVTETALVREKLDEQKTHIFTLQEKVKVLNRNIDDQELELAQKKETHRNLLAEERTKWKTTLSEVENDCRCKLYEMEQQLQKQRQRSLQLLDEKDQEIKTMKTSFEVFQSAVAMPITPPTDHGTHIDPYMPESNANLSSDGESFDGNASLSLSNSKNKANTIRPKKLSIGDNCHMLHYANEIARKDIEIAALRRAKYIAETSLRKAIQEKVNAQEDLCDKIATLEEEVDRLERCKTREGANLEYLKNVVIQYMLTKDADGKRHMINAISAVLQFSSSEIQTITSTFYKK